MDIYSDSEVVLRQAGYMTRILSGMLGDTLCFEDDLIIGFLHRFDTAHTLIDQWRTVEKTNLSRHTSQIRSARNKAWNVYCVFLTEDVVDPELEWQIDRIEENVSSTRKIVRAGVTSSLELEQALLPLLPIQRAATFLATNFDSRLRGRLKFLAPLLVDAILRGESPDEIARLAREGS